MKKLKKRAWRVNVRGKRATVEARTPGGAVHKACRKLVIPKPPTDHETAGWKGVSWEVMR
jgi:hypothetical protein